MPKMIFVNLPVKDVAASDWVPDFAKGFVRDLDPRWACEEIGLPYDEIRLLNAAPPRPRSYFADYLQRAIARPAFKAALAAQFADFKPAPTPIS